jgi:hypothetical protein
MMLTGKAREDFEIWLDSDEDNLCGLDLFQLNQICINALIIEWFDSDDRINFQDLYLEVFKDNFLIYPITSIQTEAIKKANEIYNGKL